jgi:hypothetical protein
VTIDTTRSTVVVTDQFASDLPAPVWTLVPWFGAAAMLCILATLLPLRIALTRLEAVEQ